MEHLQVLRLESAYSSKPTRIYRRTNARKVSRMTEQFKRAMKGEALASPFPS